DIELAGKHAAPQLSPGVPLKGNRKRVAESCQHLSVKVVFEDPMQTPGIDMLQQCHPYHFDGAKWPLCAAHVLLAGRSNNQGNVMELGERCRMRISDIRHAHSLWVAVRS